MKKTLLIFASFFVFLTVFSQTFTALNSGTGTQLHGIDFITANKGVAVGDGGKILTTSNGLNWVQRTSGVTAGLNDVKYINATTIIAVGWGGTVVKSTDSGWNWSTVYPGGGYHLKSIYVNGTDLYATGQDGVIIKSTDEGASWAYISPGTGDHIFNIFFIDEMVGFAVGNDARIHKTINGGASWTNIYSFDIGVSEDFQLRSICFTDANTGYIVGKNLWANNPDQSIFLRTIDGGAHWTQQIVYGTAYVDIKFLNSDVGYIISQNESSNTGVIFKTTNGGANWSILTSVSKSLTDITFPSASVGYACGFNGAIFKSTNIDLGIEDLENDQAISIYPNPSSEKVFINLNPSIQNENLIFEICSISGERIISQLGSESIDISYLPSGVYLLKIQDRTNSWTKKIIKE